MENEPKDDWFDKIMVFLSNNIMEITEEWFKLLEWLLIISAISFIAKNSDEKVIFYISNLSILLIWLRCFIGYHAKLHDWFQEYIGEETTLRQALKKQALVWLPLAIFAACIASIVHSLAMSFSNELVHIING